MNFKTQLCFVLLLHLIKLITVDDMMTAQRDNATCVL